MKYLIATVLFLSVAACGSKSSSSDDPAPVSADATAGEGWNLSEDAVVAHGYDVVSYFSGEAVPGTTEHSSQVGGVTYLFSSAANKASFDADPAAKMPAYGGWCATAMAMNMKIDIQPDKFEVRDGRLYLFSNVDGQDALVMWQADDSWKMMIPDADRNWATLQGR